MSSLAILLVATICVSVTLAVKVTPGTHSFSSASKGGTLRKGLEETVFMTVDGPGYITQQWITNVPVGTRVKIYIDDELEASIDFDLYMFIGVGNCSKQESSLSPWSNRRFGQLADNGGIFNNIRIPFRRSVTVKMVAPVDGTYWYIIRFVVNSPLIVNGYELPNNTRLRLYHIDNKLYQPYEFVYGASVNNSAGWLYMVSARFLLELHAAADCCSLVQSDNVRNQLINIWGF